MIPLRPGGEPGALRHLYRTNAQSRALEDVFVNWNMPYKIVGGVRFYERKEVKDVLSYLRVVNNPLDSVSIRRIMNVPPRGMGATTLGLLEEEVAWSGRTLWDVLQDIGNVSATISARSRSRLTEFAALIARLRYENGQRTVTELTERVLKLSGYEKMLEDEGTVESQTRLENVKELLSKARQYDKENEEEGSLGGLLENVSLVADIDSLDQSANAVTLMTLHSAKGLEFPVVFLVGLEENELLPHPLDGERQGDRGGAPSLLRGDHARPAGVLFEPRTPAAAHYSASSPTTLRHASCARFRQSSSTELQERRTAPYPASTRMSMRQPLAPGICRA